MYRVSIGVAGGINVTDEQESKIAGAEIAALPESRTSGLAMRSFLRATREFSDNRIFVGRAEPLCPVKSHVDLLGDCQGVIDLDAEVAHGALNF